MWLVPALCVALTALCLMLPVWPFKKITGGFIDLQVYRLGVQALWHGGDMYGQLPQTTIGIGLPFIYPPFAALVLAPFALVPWDAARIAFFVTSVAALAISFYLVARRVWPGRTGSGSACGWPPVPRRWAYCWSRPIRRWISARSICC